MSVYQVRCERYKDGLQVTVYRSEGPSDCPSYFDTMGRCYLPLDTDIQSDYFCNKLIECIEEVKIIQRACQQAEKIVNLGLTLVQNNPVPISGKDNV